MTDPVVSNHRQIFLEESYFLFPEEATFVVQEVLGKKEYDLPAGFTYQHPNPVIVDIGANVGAYTVWSKIMYPKAKFYCYEPSLKSFKYLTLNVNNFGIDAQLFQKAVGNTDRTKLYQGRKNCGMNSFNRIPAGHKEEYEEVETISPSEIPTKIDILKIDTEGCELEILNGLKAWDFDMLQLEYHTYADRLWIQEFLKNKNYHVLSGRLSLLSGSLTFIRPNKYIQTADEFAESAYAKILEIWSKTNN